MLGGAMMVRVVVQESSITVSAAAAPNPQNSLLRRPATLRENLESHRTSGVMTECRKIDNAFFRQIEQR